MLRLTLTLASSMLPLAATAAPGDGDMPNVIFILADDLGYGELGSYGQQKIRTPHLDKMASEGMRFTQHYSGAPLCAPSRSVLMTGQHLGRTPVRNNKETGDEGQFPLPDETFTMAELFKQHGYATGAFGKWGLGMVGTTGDPNNQGFDTFYGYNCQRVAHSFYPPHMWHNDQQITINENPVPGRAAQPEGEVRFEDWLGENYGPDLILDQALQFIDTHKDNPFFLYLPFIEPHVAIQPHPEDVAAYPEAWDTDPYRGAQGYTPHPRPRAGYAAMITDLDEHVGQVLAKLDEHGLAENTLIIFSSDNGATYPKGDGHVGGADTTFFESNGELRGFKSHVYEGGLRVPMLVRWPGRVAPGSVSDQVSYFPDHFASFCELLGTDQPENTDGQSLLGVFQGQETFEHEPLVWVFSSHTGNTKLALRMGDWKAVCLRNKTWELYNLAEDIGETRNLAASHPEIVAQAVSYLRTQAQPNEAFPATIPDP